MYPLVPKAMSTPVAGRTPQVAVLFLYLGKFAFVLQIIAKMLPRNWIRVPLILGYPGARREEAEARDERAREAIR